MADRPQEFNLNFGHPFAQGLVFAGLGRHSFSTYFHDSSLYGNHGTLTNMDPPTDWVWVPKLGRWALDFDSTDDYVNLLSPFSLKTNAAFSIGFWSYWTSMPSSTRAVFTWQTTGNSYRNALFNYTTSLAWRTRSTGGAATHDYVLSGLIPLSVWNYLSFVFDGLTKTVRLNGAVIGTPADPTGGVALTDSTGNIGIGKDYLAAYVAPPGLRVADFSYWSRALCDSEIARLADPSNVMLDGLILPPRRRIFRAAAAPPAGNRRRRFLMVGADT